MINTKGKLNWEFEDDIIKHELCLGSLSTITSSSINNNMAMDVNDSVDDKVNNNNNSNTIAGANTDSNDINIALPPATTTLAANANATSTAIITTTKTKGRKPKQTSDNDNQATTSPATNKKETTGKSWDKQDSNWYTHYAALIEHLKEFGHCNVPKKVSQ